VIIQTQKPEGVLNKIRWTIGKYTYVYACVHSHMHMQVTAIKTEEQRQLTDPCVIRHW